MEMTAIAFAALILTAAVSHLNPALPDKASEFAIWVISSAAVIAKML
jgi:hypothetical protein